ncbi:MAG: glycosyltransferase family 4 protein [Ignavibacteriales bacterium]|nr:MAG: glycosyltransferase family 4 protein [Ignavibacteriales bacterium]
MRIAIDARILERKMTGVGRYISGLLNHIQEYDSTNQYILISQVQLKNLPDGFESVVTGNQKFIPEKLYSPVWTNFVLPKVLKNNEIDIFFSSNQLVPIRKVKGVKYISAIYDVFHRVDKSFHSRTFRTYIDIFLRLTISKSDHTITISENSKKDIQRYFSVSHSKISVIYPAADEQFHPQLISEIEREHIQEKYSLAEKYILYVGVIEKRKNIYTILKVADEFFISDPEIKFVMIGRPGYGSTPILNEVKKRRNIIYLNHILDNDLVFIYNLASVFIFPSFYEGFGLPPVEAMQTGIPVVASNTSSLKEILEGSAILIDPLDDKTFYKEIKRLLNDPKYSEEWRNKGLVGSRKFNFAHSAKELVKLFNSIQSI